MPVTINGEPVRPPRAPSAIVFPYGDIGDAITVAEGLLNGGGVSLSRDQLAASMGLAPNGGGFAGKIATARIFGLIDSSSGKYQLTELGYEIVDPSRQAQAKIASFLQVPLYKRIYDEFRNKMLPPRPHGLEKAIINFGVTEKNARAARQAFERSARVAGFYPGGNEDRLVEPFGVNITPPLGPPDVHEAAAPEGTFSQSASPQSQAPEQPQRPLEYQLVDLLKEEGVTEPVSDAIWAIVRFLSSRQRTA